MAGRGRGRGKPTMSISNEQLGLSKEQQPPQVAQPPPKFPPLIYKPITFNITDELSYLFELKRDFAEFMKESAYNVEPVIIKKDIDRYSDHYVSKVTSFESRYDWSRMPVELKPLTKKRKSVNTGGGGVILAKRRDINIEEKLKELEKKEVNHNSDIEEDAKEEEDKEEKDPDEIIEDEEEDVDEEMDDGTDYVNNYFDNGEGYDEEEDNIDDGPVY